MSRSWEKERLREGFDDHYEPKQYYDDDSHDAMRQNEDEWGGSSSSGKRKREADRQQDQEPSRSPSRKPSKSEDPKWIETIHERYSTKAIKERFADPLLWPPKSASDQEHLDAQIYRKDVTTRPYSARDDEDRISTSMQNFNAVNDLHEQGISVKHFTGDPAKPYETHYKHPNRPDRLDRDAVDKWAK